MSEPVIKALHTGISVLNMEESVAWYGKNLGFHVLKDDGFVPPLEAKIVFLQRDGYQIELFEYKQPIPLPRERRTPNSDLQTVGTKHLAFQTNDMAALKERFQANGVDIALECCMDGESVMFVRDPSGVLLEFIQPAD